MNNSEQDQQEQRTHSTTEDSTTMTIEFLRACLLSERSVSRSARQRADELEKRVVELEEQLKIISLQRKRAEKATADVLAILDTNGVSDFSEEYDSSSDQENSPESQIGDGSAKEEGSFVNSKVRKNESEELSVSDHDFSPAPGRSLSWKGPRSASNSPEKYNDSLARRRNRFGSVGFSQPKRVRGKSCRQIKHRELRIPRELKKDDGTVSSQVNEVVTSLEINISRPEDGPDILSVCSEIGEHKGSIDRSHLNPSKDGKNVNTCDLDLSGPEGERNMEKAIEHQAQLIGRHKGMERAQREWEQKLWENNKNTPDSCDAGNHSDVTEERDELRTNAQAVAVTAASANQDSMREHPCFCQEFSKTQSICSALHSRADVSHVQDRRNSSLATKYLGAKSQGKVSTFPMTKQCLSMENPQSNHFQRSFSSHVDRVEASGGRKELSTLVPQETSREFTGVLDALKKAKLSLQRKVNRFPVVENGAFGQSISSSIAKTEEMSVGCASLFRVPADFSVETGKPNFMGSNSQLNLQRYYPDTSAAPTGSNQFVTSSANDQEIADPYRGSNSRFSTGLTASSYMNFDGLVSSRYPEMMQNASRDNPSFDPYTDQGVPGSGLYNPPTFLSYPSPLQQSSSRDRHPTFGTSMTGASTDRFSFYDTRFKPELVSM